MAINMAEEEDGDVTGFSISSMFNSLWVQKGHLRFNP